jgi:hypothetical protein
MGMDVHGRNPTGERGDYFRNNAWAWPSLADYCITVAPDICAACTHWYSNDGDGLDAAGALALADALENEIRAKRTQDVERRERSAWDLAFPKEPCDICAGTGVEMPGPQRGAGDLREREFECRWCRGAGYIRPWRAHYPPFSTENVAAFAAFLRESGGFSIW